MHRLPQTKGNPKQSAVDKVMDRIELLRDVLAWSLATDRILNQGQRICINQERAAWMRELERAKQASTYPNTPRYTVPAPIEEKIGQIAGHIAQENFNRSKYELQIQNSWM